MFGVNKDSLCILCQIVHIHCGDIIVKLSSAAQAAMMAYFITSSL